MNIEFTYEIYNNEWILELDDSIFSPEQISVIEDTIYDLTSEMNSYSSTAFDLGDKVYALNNSEEYDDYNINYLKECKIFVEQFRIESIHKEQMEHMIKRYFENNDIFNSKEIDDLEIDYTIDAFNMNPYYF